MPIPQLITNPNRLVPNAAQADRNALVTMRGRQQVAQGQRQVQQQPIMDARATELFLMKAAPTFGNLTWLRSEGRAKLEGMGIKLPTDAEISQQAAEYGGEEQAWDAWKARYIEAAEPEEPDQRPFTTWMTPEGKPVNIRKGEEPPAGSVPFKGKGLDIQFGEEGGVRSITQGGMGGGQKADITRKTRGTLEAKFLNTANSLSRIGEISSRYKSEYLQVLPRTKTLWTSLKNKFGADVPEKEGEKLRETTAFLRTTISNINKHIKEVTGAQMSEKEADRISLEVPKAGQSWWNFLWSGDSPIEFESKMEDIELTLRASMARTQWYLAKGMKYPEIKKLIDANAARNLDPIIDRMR